MARRRGPTPKPDAELRKHQLNCRLTDHELETVDACRGGLSRAAWLRTAALSRPPQVIPQINREAWAHLGKVAGGLTFLVEAIKNGAILPVNNQIFSELQRAIADVRQHLLGVKDEA